MTLAVPLLSVPALEVWKLTAHLRFRLPRMHPPDGEEMSAVVYYDHGAIGNLEVRKRAAPLTVAPAPGTIVIRVVAAGLNPVDFKTLRNPQPDFLVPKPFTIGYDVSGVVVAIGAGAESRFSLGDSVFGMLPILGPAGGGALAEYAAGDAACFAHAPRSIPLVEAAALPLVGLTVLQVLEQAGQHRRGSGRGRRMLVQAGGGGVGSFAIQFARRVAEFDEVHATASAPNLDRLTELGATHPIDYARSPLPAEPVDVVIDPMGWKYMERTLADGVLRPGGSYCHILSSDWQPNSQERRISLVTTGPMLRWWTWLRGLIDRKRPRVYSSAVVPDAAGLARIAELVDDGLVKPTVDRVYEGLEKAVEATEYLEKGHAHGKVLIRVDARGGEAA